MTTSGMSRVISVPCPGRRALPVSAAALLAIALLLIFAPASADSGLPLPNLIAVCASCHGEDGQSRMVPAWGRIGGQNRAYLAYALRLYRDNGRRGKNAGLMMPYAAVLSDAEIASLAGHYAALQ